MVDAVIFSRIRPRGSIYDLRVIKPMTAKLITTPGGELLAILPAHEYEDLCDALAHATAMADYRAGRDEGLTSDEVDALLAAPTPLAF
jgi:hypothetical protein